MFLSTINLLLNYLFSVDTKFCNKCFMSNDFICCFCFVILPALNEANSVRSNNVWRRRAQAWAPRQNISRGMGVPEESLRLVHGKDEEQDQRL